MAPIAAYSILDIDAIKAITPSGRVDGYCRIARGINNGWYMFIASSVSDADNYNVLMPDDNPTEGRWHRTNGLDIPGTLACGENSGECDIGGKAIKFFAPFHGEIIIRVGFDIAIGDYWEQEFISGNETVDKSIEIQLWNQEPNYSMNGRQFAADIPRSGGSAEIQIDNNYRWLSVFACEDGGQARDATCFIFNKNIITLIDFS